MADTEHPVLNDSWGPNHGKSKLMAEAAAREGVEIIDIRWPLLDPVDMRGLPRFVSPPTYNQDEWLEWTKGQFQPELQELVAFVHEFWYGGNNYTPGLLTMLCWRLLLSDDDVFALKHAPVRR